MVLRRITPNMPKEAQAAVTPGGAGRIWKLVLGVVTALGVGTLVADVVWHPSKRNIELLAGLIFLGFVIAADPFMALLFTLVVVPFPANTSVGTTTELLILAVAGLVLVKSKQLNLPSPFLRKDADLPVLGFWLMIMISFYKQPMAQIVEARLLFMSYLTSIVLYYLIIYLVNDRKRLWQVLTVLMILMVVQSALGLFQWVFPEKNILPEFFKFSQRIASSEQIRRGQLRVFGTFAGQEFYAEYLAFSCVLQYVLLRRARSLNAKLFWAVAMVLSVAGIFASATRGGLFSLILGMVYMIAVCKPAIPRRDLMRVVAVAMAVFYLSLALVNPLVSYMFERVNRIGARDDTVHERWGGMVEAAVAIGESPWLGHGIAIPGDTFKIGATKNIHCLYLHFGYIIGLPGLLAFMWLIVTLLRLTWRCKTDLGIPPDLRELALALNVVLVIFLIDEIKFEYTRSAMQMHLMWVIFALVIATWKVGERSRNTGELPSRPA